MNKQQLIERLKDYPDDMEIRIEDTWSSVWKLERIETKYCSPRSSFDMLIGDGNWGSHDDKYDQFDSRMTESFIKLSGKY